MQLILLAWCDVSYAIMVARVQTYFKTTLEFRTLAYAGYDLDSV
jgi:hypothetical protein